MKVCVIGLGYMGLPTALLFARSGLEVIGFDIDEKKVGALKNGILPFEETGLDELLEKSTFRAVSKIEHSDVYLITVPTPLTADRECDVSSVRSALNSLVPYVNDRSLVIIESTINPGATLKLSQELFQQSGCHFKVAYVAEKAIPGNTIQEMVCNPRTIGGIDEESTVEATKLYSLFVTGYIHKTDCTTAEVAKLIENAYRDINIAFANELAKKSSDWNINIWEAIELANTHPRVAIHKPGPGVGGHCIPIDPWFLNHDKSMDLITTARRINESMPQYILKKINSRIQKKSTVAVLGVAYKKNVDDARETPSLQVIQLLKGFGYDVKVSDPFVTSFHEPLVSVEEATKNAAAIIIMVDHTVYLSEEENFIWLEKDGVLVLDTKNLFKGKLRTLGNGT